MRRLSELSLLACLSCSTVVLYFTAITLSDSPRVTTCLSSRDPAASARTGMSSSWPTRSLCGSSMLFIWVMELAGTP
jgi:hypothetical protein